MINIKVVEVLKKQGYDMANIKAVLNEAEERGESFLDGWCVRYNSKGEMIILHPDSCGIYIGDYSAALHFERTLSFTYGNVGFHNAKHSELKRILSLLSEHKTNGYILCECCACDYERRKKQVEKIGYKVYKSNIQKCSSDISTCKFLIS